MLWSCSTWSFMIATSGVTTIILETAFLCNALINLGKSWKIKLFPNPVGRMAMRPLPRNTFWRQSFYSICKVSTFGKSSSACRAVIQPCVTRWRMTFARARHIAFLVCVNNPLVLTGGVKFGQSEGIPDSGIPERLPLRKFHRRSLVLSPSLPSFFSRSFARSFARFIFRSRATIWTPGTG